MFNLFLNFPSIFIWFFNENLFILIVQYYINRSYILWLAQKLLKSKQYFEFLALFRAFFGAIAKHCPLKQGLRLNCSTLFSVGENIAKHCPLKQGLRRNIHPFLPILGSYCKTLSTKTRIVTHSYHLKIRR